MIFTPLNVLEQLMGQQPQPTANMPKDARGIYGLVDHRGHLCYIGSTASSNETFYKRIHARHRTGSEDKSHYFSRMYNTGRMWRDRNDKTTAADGLIAKKLRSEFILDHCKAVYVEIPDHMDIGGLEQLILASAPREVIAWNGRNSAIYNEPCDLVDITLQRLQWDQNKLDAIARQQQRYLAQLNTTIKPITIKPISQNSKILVPSFPQGEFRFFALDVETANNDRASICQIGVAGVKADNSIITWQTDVDPKTKIWTFTGLHGISAARVIGAPSFDTVFGLLQEKLGGHIVFQHSCFDQSAIAAACQKYALSLPLWQWRDSVQLARLAWPELKGKGGHGLASLKKHLNLQFNHHDAEEDARASAQVVLLAEKHAPLQAASLLPKSSLPNSPNASAAISTAKTSTIVTKLNQPLPSMSSTATPRAKGAKPLPKNPICEAILQKIAENPAMSVHPAQKHENGTKYLSAFLSGTFTFVIDKMAASKQPIWVLDQPQFRQYLDRENIPYDEYPPNKGRNSNLHKIPNFKNGALLRIYPSTVEQAMLFLSKFGTNSI